MGVTLLLLDHLFQVVFISISCSSSLSLFLINWYSMAVIRQLGSLEMEDFLCRKDLQGPMLGDNAKPEKMFMDD